MYKVKINNMRNSINIILKKNILIILLMISMCPVLGFSYARFVINTDSYRSNEMYMAELLYTVKIDDISTYTLTLEAGAYEEEHIIEITSLNAVSTNYKLIYQNNSNVKIEYASDYIDPAFGGIFTKRTIMLRLTNNTNVNQTLSFSVVGGYSFNSLEEINIPSGYTEVNIEYWKYDYETTALYIDNIRVEQLDSSKSYELDSYTCTNNATAQYDKITRSIIVTSDKQVKCSLYFKEFTNFEKSYSYTENYEELIIPATGYYKIELWGAQGAGSVSLGGYSSGIIYLNAGEKIYFYIGAAGISTNNIKRFNSGTSNSGGLNGGGATDVRYFALVPTENELQWDSTSGVNSRIMVAGGSGSGSGNDTTVKGAGGGLIANSSATAGGTQLTYGAVEESSYTVSKFGIANGGCSGGNGYYPGGGATCVDGAGGGSSFISGYAGANAIVKGSVSEPRSHTGNTIHYSGKYFIDGKMEKGVNSGNGYAKIKYIGKKPERINTKLNNVRYIKDCTNGNTANGGNFWVELQAIKDGINLAKGIIVTGITNKTNYPLSRITDGDITSDYYAEGNPNGGYQCIVLDLGSNYDLDEIAVWHYWGDERTFNENITYVSSDNSNYVEVINRQEAETSQGKRINAYSN